MFTAFLTRSADMAHVLSRMRWGSRWSWSWTASFGGLVGTLLLFVASAAPAQQPSTKSPSTAKTGEAKAAPDTDAGQDAPAAAAPDVEKAPVADPSQTRRVAPMEVFKDPVAEEILDIKKLTPLAPAPFTQNDILRVREQAENPNLKPDRVLIDRVVRGLAAQLTDKKAIQNLLITPPEELPKDEPAKKGAPPKKKSDNDGGQAIEQTTLNLLEPIFKARGNKNDAFLQTYRRSLNQFLPPLLKNHLVPRVQAMIVLGEAASPETLGIFQHEISNSTQTLWVKLWALVGITNIRKGGTRFSTDVESKTGQTVAIFLDKEKDLPWPIQLRGLETLGWLRQAALPTRPEQAQMANTAMSFLAENARLEVRSEAARALGLMQVSSVPKFNFKLVAHAAGRLAADVAAEINNQFLEKPPRVENLTKAKYLTAMLVGSVYECFDGVQGETNSGILRTATADAPSLKYIQKVFDMVRPLAQASVELLGAPSKEYKRRKEELAGRITALRTFLEQNPPETWRLVPKGPEFGPPGDAAAGAHRPAPAPVLAGNRRAS
jgi:hypothetical protein